MAHYYTPKSSITIMFLVKSCSVYNSNQVLSFSKITVSCLLEHAFYHVGKIVELVDLGSKDQPTELLQCISLNAIADALGLNNVCTYCNFFTWISL